MNCLINFYIIPNNVFNLAFYKRIMLLIHNKEKETTNKKIIMILLTHLYIYIFSVTYP